MKHLLSFTVASLAIGLLISLSLPATATNNHNPAGNNGFIKVNEEKLSDGIPQNDPHVSCTFNVEFYNYDKNNKDAKVTFKLHAPTATDKHSLKVVSGDLTPFIGGDSAGGGNDLDAREAYKLQFGGPAHQNQGYHVKLTVEAPGSKGSDKKHKVFWVKPCVETPETPTTPTTPKPQVLGTQTDMPSVLPSTGAESLFGLSLVAAAAAYGIAYWRQKRALN
jgi:hypothetical protein